MQSGLSGELLKERRATRRVHKKRSTGGKWKEKGTIQADNDDVNSSDPVSMFLGGMLDSIKERLGSKVTDGFLNLNHGQVEETEQVYDDDDDENNPNAGELIQSKGEFELGWQSAYL
jgi:hypothetical protein